jgi:hypothetical protein
MVKENMTTESNITREQMIQLLNEDLAGEYQAVIAYTVYWPGNRQPDVGHIKLLPK